MLPLIYKLTAVRPDCPRQNRLPARCRLAGDNPPLRRLINRLLRQTIFRARAGAVARAVLPFHLFNKEAHCAESTEIKHATFC